MESQSPPDWSRKREPRRASRLDDQCPWQQLRKIESRRTESSANRPKPVAETPSPECPAAKPHSVSDLASGAANSASIPAAHRHHVYDWRREIRAAVLARVLRRSWQTGSRKSPCQSPQSTFVPAA